MKKIISFMLWCATMLLFTPPIFENSAYRFQDKRQQPVYSVKVTPAQEKTYRYEIYQGGKLIIRQENIPGFSGMKGFKRKADVEKVAKLVMESSTRALCLLQSKSRRWRS
jgi:hypothetical protein